MDARRTPAGGAGGQRTPWSIARRALEAVKGRIRGRGASRIAPEAAAVGPSSVVAEWAGRGVPNLATLVRRDLERAGLVIEELSIGTTGTYTVVSVRVPVSARATIERLAVESRLSVSFLDHEASSAIRS
ncbi:MAG: hypothetical protein ABJD07_01290 [Gemmatimonadaceae bacterium]